MDVLTDNRNRAVSEIRHTFAKNGGNLGESGSVKFMFAKKGLIAVEKSAATEEQLMDIVLEHGGEDLSDEGDTWEIITEPSAYEAVANAVKAAGIPTVMSEVTMVASTYTKLEGNRGEPDGAAAGGAGRSGRCAECSLELRHGRRTDGARGGISGAQRQARQKAARLWRSFFGRSREQDWDRNQGIGIED